MKLELIRKRFTSRSTIGELAIDGVFECFTLEDPVRPQKIREVTAIPAGAYDVEISFSPRFRVDLPLLLDVPDFTGVRIHPGNTPAHTEGCILVGRTAAVDFIGESRAAFKVLLAKLRGAIERGDGVRLEILNDGVSPFEDASVAAPALAAVATPYRVTADVVRLRSTPDAISSDNVIADLPLGHVVVKASMAADPRWMQVRTEAGGSARTGFVRSSDLEAIARIALAPEAGAAESAAKRKPVELLRVSASRLHLRRGPKDLGDDAVLATLPRGQLVAGTGAVRARLWREVETVLHDVELQGWVHSSFLVPVDGRASVEPPDPNGTVLSAAPLASGELQVSDRALDLILEFEGMNQPGKWPGESSGITIGHGYDLGYCTHDEFHSDWGSHLSPEWMAELAKALGKRGAAAKRIADRYRDITIPRKASDVVFAQRTIPKEKAKTAAAFPGCQTLPADCQGALVSLVYNRGTSMQGERRREMREIRDCVARTDLPMAERLESIARSLESMKRLWPDTRGLRRRRDSEAALVRGAG